ncbi:hypothetical protein GCM10009642_25690 [Nocardiopsis metallicus]
MHLQELLGQARLVAHPSDGFGFGLAAAATAPAATAAVTAPLATVPPLSRHRFPLVSLQN